MKQRIQRFVSGFPALLRWSHGVASQLLSEPAEDVLTVAVDVNPFWENPTGVGRYLYQILDQLRDEPGLRVRLYGPTMFLDPDDPGPVVAPPSGSALEETRFVVPDDLLIGRGRLIRILRALEPWLIAARRDRLLFAPNFVLPEKFRHARGRLVMTIHDRALKRFPWTLEQETLESLSSQLDANVERAAAVLTVSHTVRQELIEEGEIEPERVVAVQHGPGHLTEITGGRLPDGLGPRFALHVGTLEPRKNVATLFEVWRRLVEVMPEPPPLVLCGGTGWKSDELIRRLETAEAEGWVRRLGYVDDADLAHLYRRATVLLCPSLYEGFGLPVIEGLAAGLPAICSDIPVFREVAGEAAIYVAATDVDAWLANVQLLFADPKRRELLSRAALERVGHFDWRKAARSTHAVWRQAASRETIYRGWR